MSQCRVWINDCSIAVLQEVCKEPHKEGVQSQPIQWVIANKIVNGKQITICFHIDDCKISHKSTKVVDELIDWL